jgi:hypothetical protein
MNIPDLGDLWPLERDALALLEGAVLFWPEEEEEEEEEEEMPEVADAFRRPGLVSGASTADEPEYPANPSADGVPALRTRRAVRLPEAPS